MDNEAIAARLAELKQKLRARSTKPGLDENIRAIQAEIDRLTQQRAQGSEGTEDQPQS